MKPVAIASLFSLLLSVLVAPVAHAQNSATSIDSPTSTTVTPFQLVHLAYQGFLEPAGIPKFNALTDRYTNNQVSAEDLVNAAIATGRLPADAAQDSSYINQVDLQLNDLSRPGEEGDQ